MKFLKSMPVAAFSMLVAGSVSFSPASANDTAATIAAGGLVLERSEHIEMRSEDLYISPEEIKVDYTFYNNSDTDVETIVAFPMPEMEYTESPVSYPTEDEENYMDFSVNVDGKEITPEIEMKAFIADQDITQRLISLGIPLNPVNNDTEVVEKLSTEEQDRLIADKIYYTYDADSSSARREFFPSWKFRTTFYWKQTFPKGEEVKVSHRYKPFVGGTVAALLNNDDSQDEDYIKEYKETYCVDDGYLKALRKLSSRKNVAFLADRWIDYILVTGGNWSGGTIKDFRLVIDKVKPEYLVSFCFDGVKKISPTQFEIRRKNFKPEKDIKILLTTTIMEDEQE